MLRPLRSRNTDLALKIEINGDHPNVACEDCPSHTYPVRDVAALSNLNRSIDAHLRSYQHAASLKKRIESQEALSSTLTSLMLRNPNAKFGSRPTDNPLVPQIFCKICPTWIHDMRQNSVTLARYAAEDHLKSFEHERRTASSVSHSQHDS